MAEVHKSNTFKLSKKFIYNKDFDGCHKFRFDGRDIGNKTDLFESSVLFWK